MVQGSLPVGHQPRRHGGTERQPQQALSPNIKPNLAHKVGGAGLGVTSIRSDPSAYNRNINNESEEGKAMTMTALTTTTTQLGQQ